MKQHLEKLATPQQIQKVVNMVENDCFLAEIEKAIGITTWRVKRIVAEKTNGFTEKSKQRAKEVVGNSRKALKDSLCYHCYRAGRSLCSWDRSLELSDGMTLKDGLMVECSEFQSEEEVKE